MLFAATLRARPFSPSPLEIFSAFCFAKSLWNFNALRSLSGGGGDDGTDANQIERGSLNCRLIADGKVAVTTCLIEIRNLN